MFQSENELKALAEAGASRLKHFLPVILGVFTKGVPSKVKLWDIKPMIPDDLKPTQREPKLYRQLDILAEHFKAKEEQLQAIIRSYNASAGLSLVHGGPRTGKSTTALLQAMIAVSMGHKVILCAPVSMYDDLESLFRRLWSGMPEGGAPNVYIARNPASEDYRTKWCELAIASNDPNCSMPVCQDKSLELRKANSGVDHPGPWRLEGSSRGYSQIQFPRDASLIQRSPKLPSSSSTVSRITAFTGLDSHNAVRGRYQPLPPLVQQDLLPRHRRGRRDHHILPQCRC